MNALLLSDPMVLAVLEGRKTVTRRLVTVPWAGRKRALPYDPIWFSERGVLTTVQDGKYVSAESVLGPRYGRPGERTWVREAWACSPEILYQEDRVNCSYRATHLPSDIVPGGRWRSALRMPRWASRIGITIVSTRIERLHAITDDEIAREGVTAQSAAALTGRPVYEFLGSPPLLRWAEGWDALHDDAPWNTNPWVWRIEFRSHLEKA